MKVYSEMWIVRIVTDYSCQWIINEWIKAFISNIICHLHNNYREGVAGNENVSERVSDSSNNGNLIYVKLI